MAKLPYYCISLSFSATLRNFTEPLLYYDKNNANISLPVTDFYTWLNLKSERPQQGKQIAKSVK